MVLVASVSFLYFSVRVLVSDNNFANAKEESKTTQNVDNLIQYLENSVDQAPWNAIYHIALAEQYIYASTLDSNEAVAAQLLGSAKLGADQAIEIAPKSAMVVEQSAEIYRLVNNLNGPASVSEIFDTYKNAVELDPNNAYLLYSISGVYYSTAQRLGQIDDITPEVDIEVNSLLTSAGQYASNAADLRDNFWEAELIHAKALKLQNDTVQAIDILSDSVNLNPYNLTLREELGIYLIDALELDKAKEQLQIIISLESNHANAHFWLAIVYELQNDIEKAISELETVLETNPENEIVIQKLSTLREE